MRTRQVLFSTLSFLLLFFLRCMPDLADQNPFPRLDRSDLDPNPFLQFEKWFSTALASALPEPTAMTLATATKEGLPSARIVLLKGFDREGFVFYTNYESQKGRELAGNPHAALVFYWPQLGWQIRINGSVSKVSREESEEYFQTRPLGSKLGAWASAQSRVIGSRKELEEGLAEVTANFLGTHIPLPPYWGGYRVSPVLMEFWQAGASRLHDRFRYTRLPSNDWKLERLNP
jgi:pyridoxamine 5'-phosphate oxidase